VHTRTTRRGFVTLAFLGLLSVTPACVRRDDVSVRVTFQSPSDRAPLRDCTVFVGASKTWWPTIAPGETVSANVPPGGEPPELSATYRFEGTSRSWRGPLLERGVGYAVAIVVAGDGTATERHCARPCTLP